MDAGVSVYAAAAGTVFSVKDGEYDRWSALNPNPGLTGNLIGIDHGNGIVTVYYHLMKNSINVHVGDTVTAGQQIAQVGSSGNSTGPHLHFEVVENGSVVETYLDPNRWWQDPVPYTGDVPGSLDHGITNYVPTDAQWKIDRRITMSSGRSMVRGSWPIYGPTCTESITSTILTSTFFVPTAPSTHTSIG